MNFLGYNKFSRLIRKGAEHTESRGYFYSVYFKEENGPSLSLPEWVLRSTPRTGYGKLYKFKDAYFVEQDPFRRRHGIGLF